MEVATDTTEISAIVRTSLPGRILPTRRTLVASARGSATDGTPATVPVISVGITANVGYWTTRTSLYRHQRDPREAKVEVAVAKEKVSVVSDELQYLKTEVRKTWDTKTSGG